ncbi:shufflon system plasmid conjugative transfer pilus tip adhesin PilV [Pectobacterium actinidiae]|uniref:shufflon system plasmid conjugative transfer pilus tip adhesin PilV n=1 Tax=Pectobacterium actinidiae TaxID=1507808 RepID=UPI004040C976
MSIAKMPHRGWAMMEMGVALLILLGVAVWGTSVYRDYMQELQYQGMAQQGTRFKAALKEYVGRHYDTLLSQAGTTTPVIVTAAMLKNTGVLAAGFSEINTAGQRWQGAVVRSEQNPSKPQLQAVVYTQSGTALPFKGLRFISMHIDGGGYIWDAGKITGAMGMWTEPLATFGVTTTTGQLAAILTTDELSNARGESDRLYRFAVTGKPDLNRMHTAIDMGGNNINNAGNIYGQSGNFSKNANIAEDLNVTGFSSFGKRVTMNSDLAVKNGVSSDSYIRAKTGNSSVQVGGGGSSDPNAVLMNVTGGNGSGYLSLGGDGSSNTVKLAIWGSQKIRGDLTLDVANDGNTTGAVTAAGVVAGKYLLPTSTVVAGEACPSNGLIGRDAKGATLSCQNNIWTNTGGLNEISITTSYQNTCPADQILVGVYAFVSRIQDGFYNNYMWLTPYELSRSYDCSNSNNSCSRAYYQVESITKVKCG